MPFCPSCGKEVCKEDRFCRSCGQDLLIDTGKETFNVTRVLQKERGPLITHIRTGEKVLWSGKPVKLAFLFSG